MKSADIKACQKYEKGVTHADFEWIMTASCSASQFEITDLHSWIIVGCDLLMVFLVWLIVLTLEPLMKIVDKECEDAIITASDFTICIKCPRFETNPNVLTAYYH